MSFRSDLPCLIVALALVCGIAPAPAQDSANQPAAKAEEKKDPNAKPQIPENAAVDATVWGAVVYATRDKQDNKPIEKGAKPDVKSQKELLDLKIRLSKIKLFKDYKSFEVIGQHTQKIFSEYTNWVVPSKELFLNVDSKGPAEDGGMNLHVQLWRSTKVLVKTDTTLKKGSPLVIGGPKWRDGQLIFVLLLK